MIDKLITHQVELIKKQYKATTESIETALKTNLSKNQKLIELINNNDSLEKIYKTRLFKDFIKKVKKEIYFNLRTYQRESSDLELSHMSTSERKPFIQNFVSQIEDELNSSNTILDIGGGMFVASLDINEIKNKTYIWIDKDKISYEKLQIYKKKNNLNNLYLYNHSIGDHSWEFYTKDKIDLVLMLKLIPVVSRQEKHLLNNLANINAKSILITGSKEALVKKENIFKREDKTIKDFINLSNKEIYKTLDIQNEFGYFVA